MAAGRSVLAVACDHPIRVGGATHQADALLRRVPARAWRCVSAGRGAKGHWCWRSWYRWTTLAMLTHAFLIVAALTERTRHPSPSGLIGLTCNELQHLFAALVARPTGDLDHRVRWSVWRRRHQARARSCHYRRQAAQQP